MAATNTHIFGAYVSGNSVIHRLDARCKLTMLLIMIATNILATTPLPLAACATCVGAGYACAHIPAKRAFCACAPLLVLVVFTALANVLFVQEGTTLFSTQMFMLNISITEGGVYWAVIMSVRLCTMLFAACLVSTTTHERAISKALESMLAPFARFGVPAHELGMIAGIALRFVPQFAEEFYCTRNAHISRGAHFGGRVRERAHALGALLVPLFTSAFRHSTTLACAMDARCYHGAQGRTSATQTHVGARDVVALVVCALVFAFVAMCNVCGW